MTNKKRFINQYNGVYIDDFVKMGLTKLYNTKEEAISSNMVSYAYPVIDMQNHKIMWGVPK